jgi:hypothetical protein
LALTRELLNFAQLTSVTIALREVEMVLRRMLDDMDSHEEGILYEYVATLTDAQRRTIMALTGSVLNEIASMAEALALPKQQEDPVSSLVGQIAVLWSDVVDVRADKLARYGEVNPYAARVLDPPLDRIILSLHKLMQALSDAGRAANRDGKSDSDMNAPPREP